MKEGSLPLVEPCPGWCQSPGSPGSDCIPNSWVKDASLTSPTHGLVPVELGRRQLGGCRVHALPWVRGQLLCAVRGGHDGEAHLTILTVQGGPPMRAQLHLRLPGRWARSLCMGQNRGTALRPFHLHSCQGC